MASGVSMLGSEEGTDLGMCTTQPPLKTEPSKEYSWLTVPSVVPSAPALSIQARAMCFLVVPSPLPTLAVGQDHVPASTGGPLWRSWHQSAALGWPGLPQTCTGPEMRCLLLLVLPVQVADLHGCTGGRPSWLPEGSPGPPAPPAPPLYLPWALWYASQRTQTVGLE